MVDFLINSLPSVPACYAVFMTFLLQACTQLKYMNLLFVLSTLDQILLEKSTDFIQIFEHPTLVQQPIHAVDLPNRSPKSAQKYYAIN